MSSTRTAPEPTPEQQRAAEMKAAGLMRDSFNGRVVPIPEPPKLVPQAEIDAGWAKIHADAAAITAQREDAERAAGIAAARELAGVAADKQAAWQRYQALAGRALEGGMLANRALFDAEWQRHLAQRAIAESVA